MPIGRDVVEGGASPASLPSDEKLPKPAQSADYHRNKRAPAARSTVTVEVFRSCRIAYGTVPALKILLGHFLPVGMEMHLQVVQAHAMRLTRNST